MSQYQVKQTNNMAYCKTAAIRSRKRLWSASDTDDTNYGQSDLVKVILHRRKPIASYRFLDGYWFS